VERLWLLALAINDVVEVGFREANGLDGPIMVPTCRTPGGSSGPREKSAGSIGVQVCKAFNVEYLDSKSARSLIRVKVDVTANDMPLRSSPGAVTMACPCGSEYTFGRKLVT